MADDGTDLFKVTIGSSSAETLERLFGPRPAPTPVSDWWRIEASILQTGGVEGTATEVWPRLVSVIDEGWTVEKLERLVDGTWRRRSIRDLLAAAGGDPL